MALLDLKLLHANINLGWRSIVHYLRKLWPWRERYGIERFRANYVHEGLPPRLPASRSVAHEPGRCTACGACDAVCPILREHDAAFYGPGRDGFAGPMSFVLAAARSAPQLPDVKETLDVLNGSTCAGCRRCDATCPEQIPIAGVAASLADELLVIEAARARVGSHPLPGGGQRSLPSARST